MRIRLTNEDMNKCMEFARESAKTQQKIEFGQSDTIPRRTTEIARDNLIGKIAEVAFAKMLKDRYDLDIELDFNFYPRGIWDKQDAELNGWRIDIKGTRQGGKWMLIEWSKLNFRQKSCDLSHLYVMASVDWNRNSDRPTGWVQMVGFADIFKLQHGVANTKVIRKGDVIPGTQTKLQADNYAIHFTDLNHNWDDVILYVCCTAPPTLETYRNPYSF